MVIEREEAQQMRARSLSVCLLESRCGRKRSVQHIVTFWQRKVVHNALVQEQLPSQRTYFHVLG